ncbi:glycoside hydrolase family 3 N-terminal domain-containing protein [uncultured Bacteroides sp.]|uniref:glycoside hydrolase family 3 N-terminal domain-containing protein n=1 Tax=uncultured Bacteroides sp. TaxID=162156 RepID=UPI002AAA6C20|nr:glycoside hydrolase family 3 N-terminal domain-containing protein [uncultured Bacteroides sp.]
MKPTEKLYTDPTVPLDIRVEDLLSRMTVEEKVIQLNQYTLGTNDIENNKGVEVKNIPAEIGSLIYFGTEPELRNRMQRHAMENSRLGIPILFGYDAIHGFRTIFPIPLAQACSWNPALVEQGCSITAQETKQSGIDWTFSPMIDVSRDPRWGRVAEGYGEDPYANAIFGQAAVRGYQGKKLDDSISIAACLKHYVGYGASEAGRDYVYTEISRQTLWDTYLPPYEISLRSGAASLMSSFNNISGIPGSANHYTLTEILRNKWGFRGLVVSDWGAVLQLINQGVAKDLKEAGKLALNAGVDIDMMSHSYDKYLKELVAEKEVEPTVLDESVRRLLRLKFQLGLFENPYTPKTEASARFRRTASLQVAEELSAQSMVLLKNDGTLPLHAVKRLAVIGPMANNDHDMLGCWWGHGEDKDIHKLLDGITDELKKTEIRYAKGCDFLGEDESGFKEALQAAKWADVVVMCMGEKGNWSGENNSHADITLPQIQQRLMQKIHAIGKKVILVLANGRPLVLGSAVDMSNAILEMWQPGTDGASAVAGILSGRINPSGKLAMTFPYSQGQIPIYYNRRSSARSNQGFYKDMTSEPLYSFAHGLSYTHYSYGELSASKTTLSKGEKVKVSVSVTNDGEHDGMETVFLYVSDPYSRISRPVKELKRFDKRMIRKGETENFEFILDVNRDLGFVDDQGNLFVEAGEVKICIGDKKLSLEIK